MKLDINAIPEEINTGKKTQKEAVNQLAVFIVQHPSIFGLNNEEEDLLGDVLIRFLEKGDNIFNNFNPNYGTFFTYFFCYVKSMILNEIRLRTTRYIEDNHSISESILNYESHSSAYDNINYAELAQPKIPYKANTVSVDDFKIACKSDYYKITPIQNHREKTNAEIAKEFIEKASNMERIIIILALKSSYYITDTQIMKISRLCKIDEDFLRNAIHLLNQSLITKATRHEKIVNRRNRAYYLRKKYQQQIFNTQLPESESSEYLKLQLNKQYKNQSNHWQMFNELLENGIVNVRPTNKAIAEIMGLCERQISYYLRKAKSLQIIEE